MHGYITAVFCPFKTLKRRELLEADLHKILKLKEKKIGHILRWMGIGESRLD